MNFFTPISRKKYITLPMATFYPQVQEYKEYLNVRDIFIDDHDIEVFNEAIVEKYHQIENVDGYILPGDKTQWFVDEDRIFLHPCVFAYAILTTEEYRTNKAILEQQEEFNRIELKKKTNELKKELSTKTKKELLNMAHDMQILKPYKLKKTQLINVLVKNKISI